MSAYPPENLRLDTKIMLKLATVLGDDARDFRHGTKALRDQFGDDGPAGMSPSKRDDRPYGADPRNVPAEAVMARHHQAVKQAIKVIRDINVSLHRSGPITQTVVVDLGGQDTTNAGDIAASTATIPGGANGTGRR